MSDGFQKLFQQELARGDGVTAAFKRTTFKYTGEDRDSRRARVREVVAALKAARKG
jgi:hypothetical protein